jgi:uracil-DNA glycosylase family 4
MSAQSRLDYLQASQAEGCTRCSLHKGRNRLVFGAGDPGAAIVVIGLAPGEDGNREGIPFIGPAGNLLDACFRRLKIDRNDLYFLNILKCRPPDDRNPTPEESSACSPFLHLQLAITRPRVVLAVGGVAGRYLAGEPEEATVGYLRSKDWLYENKITGVSAPLVVTYHPSYILRKQGDKATSKYAARKLMADLGKVVQIAGL